MGTKAIIAKVLYDYNFEKGAFIKYINCSKDGYPSYVGTILNACYTSESKIDRLLSLGDIYFLGERVKKLKNAKSEKVKKQSVTKPFKKNKRKTEDKIIKESEFFDSKNIENLKHVDFVYLYDSFQKRWATYSIKVVSDKKVIGEFQRFLPYKEYANKLIEKGLLIKPTKEFKNKKFAE